MDITVPIIVDGEDITQCDLWKTVNQLAHLEGMRMINMPLSVPIIGEEDKHYAPLVCKYLSHCHLNVEIKTIGEQTYLVTSEY